MLQLNKIRRQNALSLLPCICKAKSTFVRVNSYIAFLLVCKVTGIRQLKTKTFWMRSVEKENISKEKKKYVLFLPAN